MEREAFYYLYVNVNSIAELAFKQLAAQILAEPHAMAGPQDPAADEHLSEEELQARMMAGFENLDWSALDGVGVAKEGDEPLSAEYLAGFAASQSALPEFSADEAAEAPDAQIDIETYLARAYSYEEQLRERIDAHFAHVDLAAMQAVLAQLPDGLQSLTGPLSATQMTEWLQVYDQENPALNDLTLRIRRLDTTLGPE